MLFLYFIQVFAYRTRAGVFLQRYFYFLVFSCVASDSLYNPVMGFFSVSRVFLGKDGSGGFPFASAEMLSAGVSCLLVLGKGAAVLRVERLLVRRCSCAMDYRFLFDS